MEDIKNHAEICPVCKGTGKYKQIWDYGTTTIGTTEMTCHRV